MTKRLERIAVIIVNYGTCDLAIRAVDSVLERRHGNRDISVNLVDNASPGNDSQILNAARNDRGWGDRVKYWPQSENLGFGRGNNVVLDHLLGQSLPPDLVFLLNPDAQLENEAVDLLANTLESNPNAAAAGAGIRNPDGSRVTSAFRFPGLISQFLDAVNFGPLNKLFSRYRVPLPPDHAEGIVDWVSGAAIMLRIDALREVGVFDSDFFLYLEETELQHRLKKAGWNVIFNPEAEISHDAGAATGQFNGEQIRRRLPSYLYQSNRLYFIKCRGWVTALTVAVLMLPAAAFNVVQRRARGKSPTLPLRFFRDHMEHVLLPLVGLGRKT